MDGRVLGINVGSSTFEHEAVYYAVPYATIEQQIADWKSRLGRRAMIRRALPVCDQHRRGGESGRR